MSSEQQFPTSPKQGWLKLSALAAIRFYQVALRPLNPWGCKFHPSCSNYALEAIERFGPAPGAWLALRRLWRCRPGVFGGYDPVPERAAPAAGAKAGLVFPSSSSLSR